MKLLSMLIRNFKGIRYVKLNNLNPGTTVIGGKNRAGKSSFLDAISAALGGAKLIPKRPIHEGANEARVEIELEGEESILFPHSTVIRTWRTREDGSVVSELEIVSEDGYKSPSPQTALNELVGPLVFDPEMFLRLSPKERSALLQQAVGLDTAALDEERAELYAKRTDVNRKCRDLQAQVKALTEYPEATEEVSVAGLMQELKKRNAHNQANVQVRNRHTQSLVAVSRSEGAISKIEAEIESLKKALVDKQTELKQANETHATIIRNAMTLTTECESLVDADVDEIQSAIEESEVKNRQFRANQDRKKVQLELETETTVSSALTRRIADIDLKKEEMKQAVKWPVPGLGYDDDGVTLNGRPFEQASATEQREASFGIAAALNPTLKFAVIHDGSLLDDESLADFIRLADEHEIQLFVERVGLGDECNVIISEGEISDE